MIFVVKDYWIEFAGTILMLSITTRLVGLLTSPALFRLSRFTVPTTPTTVTHGPLTYARPALHADDFPAPPRAWGKDEPAFRR